MPPKQVDMNMLCCALFMVKKGHKSKHNTRRGTRKEAGITMQFHVLKMEC